MQVKKYLQVIIICLLLIVALSFYKYIFAIRTIPAGIDFGVFYTAANMAISGNANLIYDVEIHNKLMENIIGCSLPQPLPWFYPPMFLLLIFPLGYLPYQTALIVWIIISFLAYLITIYKVSPKPAVVLATLAFPGAFMNILWGQNAFVTTALLGTGIIFIESNPILTGLMFGLLCFKPQFAFVPFIALIASRKWKALFWSLFFACITTVLSALLFGADTWRSYLYSITSSADLLTNQWQSLSAIQPTIYSSIRIITENPQLAFASQSIFSLIIILLVIWTWSSSTTSPFIRYITMSVGVVMATPYCMQYDLAILALPLAWYGWEIYKHGALSGELLTMVLVWLLPLYNWPLTITTGIQITPLIVILLIIMALRRISYKKRFFIDF